jgi:hypothetical protein
MFLSEHRKKFWVNPQIQGGLIMRAGFCWVIYHLVLWHGIFVIRYIGHRMEVVTGNVHERSVATIYGDFAADYSVFAILACFLAPLCAYDLLRQSHRVAGPLARFEGALKKLMAGQTVQPIQLRPRDQLTHFQNVFNEFLEFYVQRQRQNAEQVNTLSAEEVAIIERVLGNSDSNPARGVRVAVPADDGVEHKGESLAAVLP